MTKALKEITLRHYFEGHASASELDESAADSVCRRSSTDDVPIIEHYIDEMAIDFPIRSHHIIKLVDDVLAKRVSFRALDAVCFCMEATTHFVWDSDTEEGRRIDDAVFWLGTPEANYPLTDDVLRKIRVYLDSGENALTAADTKEVRR